MQCNGGADAIGAPEHDHVGARKVQSGGQGVLVQIGHDVALIFVDSGGLLEALYGHWENVRHTSCVICSVNTKIGHVYAAYKHNGLA
jgi:hypothetical protein